jgi:hypothetical protein
VREAGMMGVSPEAPAPDDISLNPAPSCGTSLDMQGSILARLNEAKVIAISENKR